MRRTIGFALLLLASATIASAQTTSTTRLIPYTGAAVDASGAPLSGQVSVTFELFEEQEGGAPLWRETQRVRADERGRYLVYLGAVTAMPQIAFTEERARWLAVTVRGRALPRVMLVAVPYALRAADADTLGGQPAASFVRSGADGRLETSAGVVSAPLVDGSGTAGQLAKFVGTTAVGSSILTETGANQIGIGTTDPTEGGALSSKVTIRSTDGSTALAVSNQAGIPRFALNTNSDGSWITYDRATGVYQPGIAQRGGRVGIATTDPTGGGVVDSKFTVRNLDNNTGIAVLNQLNARRFALNTSADGSWIMYDGAGGTWNPGLSQTAGSISLGDTFNTARLAVEAASLGTVAVLGESTSGTGVVGLSSSGFGVGGGSVSSFGVSGNSETGTGVLGNSGTGVGVMGTAGSGGLAGQFFGNVSVSGTLSKGGGSFTIDHPLDPANKYLQHSFVESPDMMNVYNGNAVLDANGEAWVTLPEWFEALNRDCRYQLTSIGSQANPYIAAEVSDNRFKISGGKPNGKVSWQVTGIRQDAWANAHRIAVEKDKPESERGTYLHAKEHGQPESAATASPLKKH